VTNSLAGGKWSRLDEAAEFFSIELDPDLIHHAAYDARIAAQVYLSLKADGVDAHGGYWR
jgi:DNA polymerase III epsilon subunit-like protein